MNVNEIITFTTSQVNPLELQSGANSTINLNSLPFSVCFHIFNKKDSPEIPATKPPNDLVSVGVDPTIFLGRLPSFWHGLWQWHFGNC
jgi:hypothetical protein